MKVGPGVCSRAQGVELRTPLITLAPASTPPNTAPLAPTGVLITFSRYPAWPLKNKLSPKAELSRTVLPFTREPLSACMPSVSFPEAVLPAIAQPPPVASSP